jgi:hypothetical protein
MSGLDGLCLIGLDSSDLRRGSVGSRGRALRRSVPVVVMFSVFRSPVSRGRVSRRVFRSLSSSSPLQSTNRSITHSHSHSALRDTARVAAATPYNVDRLQRQTCPTWNAAFKIEHRWHIKTGPSMDSLST